jgi:hypothetical protein
LQDVSAKKEKFMSNVKLIEANAFGAKFPVCTEDQKTRLEEAFKSATAYDEANPSTVSSCACELIIELLGPNPSRRASIEAAVAVAKDIYARKIMVLEVASAIQEAALLNLPSKGM